jgi:hypothetical protein
MLSADGPNFSTLENAFKALGGGEVTRQSIKEHLATVRGEMLSFDWSFPACLSFRSTLTWAVPESVRVVPGLVLGSLAELGVSWTATSNRTK